MAANRFRVRRVNCRPPLAHKSWHMLIKIFYNLAHFLNYGILILQTWMAAAGLGLVGGAADSVDWQDEPQEVPGEEEVAAVRTGNQVDIGNIKCIWSNLGKIRVAKVYIKNKGNVNFAGTGKFLWKVEDPSSSVPCPPRICWNFSSLRSVPVIMMFKKNWN